MQTQDHAQAAALTRDDEYVTIVAPTLGEVMQKFRDSGLAAQGFAIAGRVARHKFSFAGGDGHGDMFGGTPMTAATFIRAAHGQ